MITASVCAEMTIANRVEAVRVAVHALTGGDAHDLPESWKDPRHVWPPSPAAVFGHCLEGIRRSHDSEAASDRLHCHEFMAEHGKAVGLLLRSSGKDGHAREVMMVPDVVDVMLAGVPTLRVMLAKAPGVVTTMVRHILMCTTITTFLPAYAPCSKLSALYAGRARSPELCRRSDTGGRIRKQLVQAIRREAIIPTACRGTSP